MDFPWRKDPGWCRMAVLAAFVVVLGNAGSACAQIAEGNPRLAPPPSHLNEPFEVPVFVTGHIGLGGDFQNQPADLDYGGSLIFRAGHSVNIFSGFLGWTTDMVVQIDYLEVPDGGNILSGDLIVRRYLQDQDNRETALNIFLGLGSGVSDIRRPNPDDDAAGEYWSILAEAGQEWYFRDTRLLFIKGQYRWMINAGRTWHAWSLQAGVGLPWP